MVLCEGVLIVNASDEAEAMFGLNPESGEVIGKFDGIKNAWETPVPVGEGPSAAIVLAVPRKLLAIAPQTGKLKWFTTNGPIDTNVSASAVVSGESVLFMGSRSRTALLVQHSDAGGADVTESHTLWEGIAWGQITTPLIHEGHAYYFSEGRACCQEVSTGKYLFKERLPLRDRRNFQKPANHSRQI